MNDLRESLVKSTDLGVKSLDLNAQSPNLAPGHYTLIPEAPNIIPTNSHLGVKSTDLITGRDLSIPEGLPPVPDIRETVENRKLAQQECRTMLSEIARDYESATIVEIPTSIQDLQHLPAVGSARFYGAHHFDGEQNYIFGLTPDLYNVLMAPYEERTADIVSLNQEEKPVDALDVVRRGVLVQSTLSLYQEQGINYLIVNVGHNLPAFRDHRSNRVARRVLILGGIKKGEKEISPESKVILDFNIS